MNNPLLDVWTTPFKAPPFDEISTGHFEPAYQAALEAHRQEIAAIAASPAAPGFDNTILAMERSGALLKRIDMVFSQLASANTNDAMQAVERQVSPLLARHWNAVYLNPALFERVDALYQSRAGLDLEPEALRVLERYHLDFVRAGANLSEGDRTRFGEIVERLAVLGTQFGQNVLADEQGTIFALSETEVDGLPDFAPGRRCRNRQGPQGQRPLCGDDVALQRRAGAAFRPQPQRARNGLACLREARQQWQCP